MYALVWYTLEGFVVDIYLFDCFHNLASIGTVLMIPISAIPPFTGGEVTM